MQRTHEVYENLRNRRITIDDVSNVQHYISNECRWYLLGKLCFDEHSVNIELPRPEIFEKLRPTFGLNDSTYRRLMSFKLAVDRLHELVPEYMPSIIDGTARLSIENTMTASRWKPDAIRNALIKLQDRTIKINTIFDEHPSHKQGVRKYSRDIKPKHEQTVKDMPVFDPEAQISGICYSIPSWVTAIDRAFTATEFADVSKNTAYRFVKELTVLKDTAQLVLDMLRENK